MLIPRGKNPYKQKDLRFWIGLITVLKELEKLLAALQAFPFMVFKIYHAINEWVITVKQTEYIKNKNIKLK